MKIQNRLRVFSAARSNVLPRLAFITLLACCIGLLAIQIGSNQTSRGWRVFLTDVFAPVFSTFSALTQNVADTLENLDSFASIREENARLREENAQLKHWEQTGQKLSDENQILRNSLHVVQDLPASFLTARIISDTSSGYVRSFVINAGSDQGVKRGHAALFDGNFIGRVWEVGASSSRVLLITDFSSRIPVIAGDSSEQGILSGDNSGDLRLLYITQPQSIRPGDAIMTSGKGGGIPPGLAIGKAEQWDGISFRVVPNVNLADLRYVQIVDYGLVPLLEQLSQEESKSRKR